MFCKIRWKLDKNVTSTKIKGKPLGFPFKKPLLVLKPISQCIFRDRLQFISIIINNNINNNNNVYINSKKNT